MKRKRFIKPFKLEALRLLEPGSKPGAEWFASDAKDYDITGAMFVNGDGNDIFSMLLFWRGFV